MAKPAVNLRLFVAAYPPGEVAAAALDAIGVLELPPHRLTPTEQVHLTLQFVGDTPAKALEETLESVRRSAAGIGAFTLRPLRYITLPPASQRGRARLIALETDAPAQVIELHRRLAHRLARSTRREAADRFLPHMTLARFGPGAPPARAIAAPAELPVFVVEEIFVMRSVLRREGAQHEVVERVRV